VKRSGSCAVIAAALFLGPVSSLGAPKSSRSTVKEQARFQASVEAELVSVTKTQGLLADKLAVREAEMKQRVRAMYKLSRASFPRLWIEPDERRNVAQWLGAARRITNRDLDELKLLHEEIEVADAAQVRLQAATTETLAPVPKRRSLHSPLASTKIVAGYGDYKGPSRRVRLRRRGLELEAVQGEEVRAPAKGRVRYAGPISGLGQAIILDHDGYWSVLGRLSTIELQEGAEIAANAIVGHAAGERLYLEVRLAIGSVGRAVDPTPLLHKSR
jgi:septal ring factor EnvC (AmiA/AmiB activator)